MDRRLEARTWLTIKLPVVCPDAFAALMDDTSDIGEARSYDDDEAVLGWLEGCVTGWARKHNLEADWLERRLVAALRLIHVAGDATRSGRDSIHEFHPLVWRLVGQGDSDLTTFETIRTTPPYAAVLTADTYELSPPERFREAEPKASPGMHGIWDEADWDEAGRRRILRPVLAWPELESRDEFQTRAVRHFEARVALATSLGLTLHRKAPALERHTVWLLQQRVLKMRLDDIADLAQQERDTRRGRASSVIELGSISREITRLKKLLPLP